MLFLNVRESDEMLFLNLREKQEWSTSNWWLGKEWMMASWREKKVKKHAAAGAPALVSALRLRDDSIVFIIVPRLQTVLVLRQHDRQSAASQRRTPNPTFSGGRRRGGLARRRGLDSNSGLNLNLTVPST
jgi:hypothetical protein